MVKFERVMGMMINEKKDGDDKDDDNEYDENAIMMTIKMKMRKTWKR